MDSRYSTTHFFLFIVFIYSVTASFQHNQGIRENDSPRSRRSSVWQTVGRAASSREGEDITGGLFIGLLNYLSGSPQRKRKANGIAARKEQDDDTYANTSPRDLDQDIGEMKRNINTLKTMLKHEEDEIRLLEDKAGITHKTK
ncbi:hypothetical protein HHI36_017803 [Cryptolaemus montrouzieri]|uniref:Uncharacterized protein n=1 Tax=Cryptolaemus montrouzieri TaxID=559131 RepID=A0ABD2NNV3_9CUCU